MLHPICRPIIERTLVTHKVRPEGYRFQWLPGVYDCHGRDLEVDHDCPAERIRIGDEDFSKILTELEVSTWTTFLCLRCDNFPFHGVIPTECFIFHGQCDKCRTVVVAERKDAQESWEDFVRRKQGEPR